MNPLLEEALKEWKQHKYWNKDQKICTRCKRQCNQNEFRIVDQFLASLTSTLERWYLRNINSLGGVESSPRRYHLGWHRDRLQNYQNYCPECFYLLLRINRVISMSEDLFTSKQINFSVGGSDQKIQWGDTQAQELFQLYNTFLQQHFPMLWCEIMDKPHPEADESESKWPPH